MPVIKCPKCKRIFKYGGMLYAKQKYSTTITVEVSPRNGQVEQDIDNIASGYTDVWDFIDSMLVEDGKYKILGCEKCFSR